MAVGNCHTPSIAGRSQGRSWQCDSFRLDMVQEVLHRVDTAYKSELAAPGWNGSGLGCILLGAATGRVPQLNRRPCCGVCCVAQLQTLRPMPATAGAPSITTGSYTRNTHSLLVRAYLQPYPLLVRAYLHLCGPTCTVPYGVLAQMLSYWQRSRWPLR
jgi:hypothetical protein